MADQELERVFITFLANDKDLEKNYRKIVERAKQVATEVGREFQQATGKGMSGMSSSVEQDANRMEKALADVYRAITALTEALAKTRGRQRETTKTTDETREAFLRLRNETAALRHTVEAGATSTAAAIARFKELQEEALDASNAFAKGSNEYRQFTQVAAQAARSIATLEGRTTKLGFSANNAIGVTAALRQHVDFLGRNAGIAGSGFAALGIALRNFQPVGEGVQGIFEGIRRGLMSLQVAVPLATAAITAGLTLALIRVGSAAAETADQIDKASRSIGFTAEAFQEISFALEQSGVSIDQTRQGLQDMNARLGQAAGGATSIVNAYQQLGVAIRDSNGAVRDSEVVFMDLISALSQVPSTAEKAALGGLVFGEEFSRRVIPALDGGVEGFQALRDQAREMGLILTNEGVQSLVQFKDAWNVLTRQINTAKTEIVAAFMPVITRGLIPLLQDTLVPALQNVATRANEMATAFFDAGEEGRVFREQIAVVGARVQAVGQFLYSLGQISVGLIQVLTAPFAALGAAIGNVSVGLEAMIDVYRRALQGDFSGFAKSPAQVMREAGVNMRTAIDAFAEQARLGLANLGTGGALFFGAFDFDALEAQWRTTLDGVVAGTRDATRELSGLADVANDALTGIGTLDEAAPEGSLAALRQQLADARRDFELAITDEARAASLERIGIIEAEIQEIESRFRADDPLEPARIWLGRLSEELRFGQKTAQEVYDIVSPTVERLREEARAALQEFGWDSQQYRDTVAKLEFVEGFLERVLGMEPTVSVRIDTSKVEADWRRAEEVLARRFSGDAGLLFTLQAVERTQGRFATLEEAFVGLARAGITITGPMLEFLIERFGETEAAVDRVKAALAELREAELQRLRDIQISRFSGDASVVLTVQAVERTTGEFTSVEDAMRKLASVGVTITAPMLALLEERFAATAEGADTLRAALSDVHQVELQRARDALTARFRDDNAILFTVQAVERTAGAFTSVEDAMRKLADAGVVVTGPMLALLAERFEDVSQGAEATGDAIRRIIDVEVPQRLAAAAASAALFGTQSELAATSADILRDAIERILLLDPEADVTELMEAWKAWRLEAGKGKGEAADLSGVLRDLEAAQERLAELTGEAPSEWDNLRAAFQAAADAAVITREELEKFLEVLEKLEQASESARALNELAGNIDIGTQIATGLTSALEGIRDGDVNSVLSGLTDIGVAIGTAIGGPAVGAIVGAIGQAVQALPSLFQAISDLFTGDSPARRKLAASLTQTIEGAVRSGIDAGLRGADDWRDTLRSGIRESVVGALVDAFIEAAVTQAIIAPFVDEFTRILHRQGRDAALAFLEANLNSILSAAEAAAAGIVSIFDRFFDDVDNRRVGPDPLRPVTFELPDATVSVLAAPQWALELTTAAGTISLAGEAMLEAATMMQATFQAGITVNNQSTRGIDALRAAL